MRAPQPLVQVARGFAMGLADVVPGVSGGTVALVLGIYERLVGNIRQGAHALGVLARRDVAGAVGALGRVQWCWLAPLLGGVLAAVVALASVIERLLDDHAQTMAGLFFGLIAASLAVAWRQVRHHDLVGVLVVLGVGAALFVLLGLRVETASSDPEVVTQPLWLFFLAGALAICAMILPGVSGAFLLVMMGMYAEVLGAVNDRDLVVLGAVAAGCVAGLAAFSTLLSWLLVNYHDRVLAVMVGLMLGSLRVLWPWPGGTETTELALPSGTVVAPVLAAAAGLTAVVAVDLVGRRTTRPHRAMAATASDG